MTQKKNKERTSADNGALMRNPIVVLLASLLAICPPCHALLCHGDFETPNTPEGMDIALFTRLFLSETESEFHYKVPDADEGAAEEMWRSATDFEWCRAIEEEYLNSRKFPFIVCVSDDEKVSPATGHDMRKELMSVYQEMNMDTMLNEHLIGSDDVDAWDKHHGMMYHPPLYNGPSLYCTYSTMFASDAIAMAHRFLQENSHNILVQPYMMPMKMMPHTVEELMERMTPVENTISASNRYTNEGVLNLSGDNRRRGLRGDQGDTQMNPEGFPVKPRHPLEAVPSFDAMICPGVLPVNATDDQKDELIRDIDEFLCGERRHEDEEEEEAFFSGLSDAFFWITNKTLSRNDTMASSMPRSEHWKQVFGLEYKGQEQCYNAFRRKLEWNIGGSSQTSEASLHVSFQNVTNSASSAFSYPQIGNDMATSRDCAMLLVVALGLHPALCHVEVRHVTETLNLQAQWLIQSGQVNERPWFDVGLDGTNQVVAVSDTGVDVDNCYFWDADKTVGDPDHRKIVEYNAFVDNADFRNGHGTHVAGTIVGRRAVGGGDVETTGLADGVAREARIAFADVGDEEGNLFLPFDDFSLLRTGRSNNISNNKRANIHSASWGAPGINFYSFQARNFDRFMVENDDFLILVAAGNTGRTDVPGSITSPATAKNVIAVGASQSFGTGLFPGQRGPAFVADFSSRGPTADGRTKPEVVAPGMFLVSAGGNPSVTGECDPDGATPPRPLSSANGVLSLAGTSMATPATSGSAALIRQYFEEGFYPSGIPNTSDAFSPSGALVKAVLLNGAQFLEGVDNRFFTTPVEPYDNTQNFGRISLADSLLLAAGKSRVEARVWDREVVSDGIVNTYEVAVRQTGTCSTSVLSVTLVWIDPAAPPGCRRCLLNNLDLRVISTSDGTVHFPNGNGAPDDINTAERVQVGGLSVGDAAALDADFRVEVSATSLASREQSFALVATGCFGMSLPMSPTQSPVSSSPTVPTIPSLSPSFLPPANEIKPTDEIVNDVDLPLPTTTSTPSPAPTPGDKNAAIVTFAPAIVTSAPTVSSPEQDLSVPSNDDDNATRLLLGVLVGLSIAVLIGIILLMFGLWRQRVVVSPHRRSAAGKQQEATIVPAEIK